MLQLVVSIVFIQRHFEGVTRQLTQNVLIELSYIIDSIDQAPTIEAGRLVARDLGPVLDIRVRFPAMTQYEDRRKWYDLTGRVVIEKLRDEMPNVVGIDLVESGSRVNMTVDSRHGRVGLTFSRKRVSASNPHQLLVLMIFTGILMTFVSFVFLRNQLKSITRLAEAADAFGKGRPIKYRPSGATEVRSAGAAFLDMRARIERQIEQRTLMLSGVSHDLRTPLTRMTLQLNLMEETEDTAALLSDVQDMQSLVDEFLAFSRGDALDDPVPVDATALALQTVSSAQRAGQKVELGQIDTTGVTPLRATAIVRALENLIGNAVRYGGYARVSVHRLDKFIRIRVEDNGPGIAEEDRDQAVKPFARLDPARNLNMAGAGLGLSIAADIARSHGGSLKLGRSVELGGLCADLILSR